MKSLLFTIVIIIVLSSACSTPLKLPLDYSTQKKVLLPFRIDSIIIVDNRLDTVTAEMKLPPFAMKKREWMIRPALRGELKAEILQMVNLASYPDGIPSIVTLKIEEGYYKITGDAMQVGEHAKFDCVLHFDFFEQRSFIEAHASAFYDFQGVYNATEKHVKEVYRITVRNSLFNALTRAEKALDK